MGKIEYRNNTYNIADIINFEGTYHLIITSGNQVYYVNKQGNSYYEAPRNLIISDQSMESLVSVRKQHILRMLIEYITANELYSDIKYVTALFKEYIKTSYIETFLYWPYMTDEEALKQLENVKKDLNDFMNEKLRNKVDVKNNEQVVVVEVPNTETKFLPKAPEKEWIKDPSARKK